LPPISSWIFFIGRIAAAAAIRVPVQQIRELIAATLDVNQRRSCFCASPMTRLINAGRSAGPRNNLRAAPKLIGVPIQRVENDQFHKPAPAQFSTPEWQIGKFMV